MKALLCLNLCYGVLSTSCPIFCFNSNKVIKNIIEVSDGFDYFFIVNDEHNLYDKELDIMPNHCIKNSKESMRISWIESNIKCKKLQYFKKNTFNALDNVHIFSTLKHMQIDDITVVGFCASFDVLETISFSIDKFAKVSCIESCLGDLNEASLNNAIKNIKEILCQ